jgi:hypothetical protein
MQLAKSLKLGILALLLIALTIFPGCGGTAPPVNHSPTIIILTADSSSIDISQSNTITCIATDQDGDTLTYIWTKNGGTITGTGSVITWTAPATTGNYTITCTVSDGKLIDMQVISITVTEPEVENHSPVIISNAITSATVGETYTYNVDATDPDGDTLIYSFSAVPTGMTINSSTGLINWTPTTTGSFGVYVKVSDGELTDIQGFIITVLEPEGYAVNVTDSSGRTSVVVGNKQINVNVKDEYGVPIPSITVKAYALDEDVLIFAGSENYLPGIKILTPSEFSNSVSSGLSQLKTKSVTIGIMVLSAVGIAIMVYEYYNNPGEFPVQIPGLIEGQRKVESTCVQIDGNDVISIGSAILSGLTLYKGVQVLGAPAQLRGVTAMNYGFTKNMVLGKEAKMIGKAFTNLVGILDTDIINTCTYEYKTNDGYEEMPYLTFDVQRSSTQEVGQISGSVKDAVTQSLLPNVSVKVYDGSSLISSGMTNSNSVYSVLVPAGSGYRVEFTKSGYIPAIYYDVSVEDDVTTYLETVLQIDDNYSGEGNISGKISNALTGGGVSGLAINLREGINVTSGTVIASEATGSGGYYSVSNLNVGYYTAEVSGTGYNTTYFTVICIGGTTTANQNATITPILSPGETRIILTWGETPRDLDSHLTGPLPDGTRFHMYYWHAELCESGCSGDGSPWPEYVKLDKDDTSSYGPETTTIYQQISGVYRFSVHDYTNCDSSYSTALSNSGAQVRVYRGNNFLVTFNVPANQEGTLWTVFEMDGDTIIPINTMSYEFNPSVVIQSSASDAELMKNLLPKR